MLDAKLKFTQKHGEENVKHKPAIEDLWRLKKERATQADQQIQVHQGKPVTTSAMWTRFLRYDS